MNRRWQMEGTFEFRVIQPQPWRGRHGESPHHGAGRCDDFWTGNPFDSDAGRGEKLVSIAIHARPSLMARAVDLDDCGAAVPGEVCEPVNPSTVSRVGFAGDGLER